VSAKRKPEPRVRWILAIAITVVVNTLLFATRSGTCVDYVNASIAGSCATEPILGAAGTWAIAAVSAIAVAYFVFRVVKAARTVR
jgi:hypothetical protein